MHAEDGRTQAVPSTDEVFRRVVEVAFEEADSADDLQRRLRSLYPKVVVRERGLSEEPRVFYVYRDGRFRATRDVGWWLAPEMPRIAISGETGRIVELNGWWADLMGERPDRLEGRHFTDLVLPEAQATATRLFESIRDLGGADGDVLLRRPDGALVTLEFHARMNRGRVEVWYRQAPSRRQPPNAPPA